MRKFLLSLACVALLGACGDTDTVTPVEECEECTCDGCCTNMVPAVHDHPDAQPVDPDETTGHYLIQFLLTGNSCKEDFNVEDEIPSDPMGWMIAATQDEYIFLLEGEGFMLSSPDGIEPFSLEINLVAADGDWTWCTEELYEFSADLDITNLDLTGTYTKHYIGTECPVDFDEDGNLLYEDSDCTYTWSLEGTRQ